MFPVNERTSPNATHDTNAKLFLEFLKYTGHVAGLTDGYDNFLHGTKFLLSEKKYSFKTIELGNIVTVEYSFDDCRIVEPTITPIQIIERGTGGYNISILVNLIIVNIYENGKRVERVIKDIPLGDLPLLIGSFYDPLTRINSNGDNMVKHGEDPACPPRFITAGSPKTFNLQENLRVNMVLTYSKSNQGDLNDLVSTITTESRLGQTTMISIYQNKAGILKYANFRGYSEGKGKKSIDVLDTFILLKYYEFGTYGDISEFLLLFTKPQWRDKVRMALSISLVAHHNRRQLPSSDRKSLKSILKKITSSVGKANLTKELDNVLFTHIDVPDVDTEETFKARLLLKSSLLALLVVRLIECKLKLRNMHNRNSYSVKRFKNVGGAMYHLFGIVLDERIKNFHGLYYSGNKSLNDDAIRANFEANNIYSYFESSFEKSWGITKTAGSKGEFVERLKDEQYVLQHTHVNKIVRGRDVHSKDYQVRKVDGSQNRSVCIAETPESNKVSLNNTKANGEYNSQHRDYKIILNHIKEYSNLMIQGEFKRSDEFNDFIMVNGIILGVCDGLRLSKELITARRYQTIPFDVVIHYEPEDSFLYINSDAGRPVAPCHVVTNGKLEMETNGMMDQLREGKTFSIPEIMNSGAIDFVDPLELENKKLCFSTEEFERLQNIVRDTKLDLETLRSIQEQVRKNPDKYIYYRSIYNPSLLVSIEEFNQQYDKSVREILKNKSYAMENYIVAKNELKDLVASNDLESFEDRFLEVNHKLKQASLIINRYDDSELEKIRDDVQALSLKEIDMLIKEKELKLKEDIKNATFDYCDIDPLSALGITVSLLPFLTHNPGPRQTFGCKMIKQAEALSTHSQKWNPRPTKYITYPCRSPTETATSNFLNLNTHCVGTKVIIAIAIGQNVVEDMLTMSQGFVQSGGFQSVTSKSFTERINNSNVNDIAGASVSIEMTNNLPEEVTMGRSLGYEHLDENGIVRPGTVIKTGDVLIGRFKRIDNYSQGVKYVDISIYAKRSNVGKIQSMIIRRGDADFTITFHVDEVKTPEVGDKFSNGHAQKSTIGEIKANSDMIYSADTGINPDVLINSHSQPSRMTVGMIKEIITGKAQALSDKRYDSTAYRKSESISDVLLENGFSDDGFEDYINPHTGNYLQVKIFTGICYYYRLVHESGAKIQNRDVGAYKAITHQSNTGINFGGGQRMGEGEIETLETHGAAHIVKEMVTRHADYYIIHTCATCNREVFASVHNSYYCYKCKKSLTEKEILYAETTYAQQSSARYQEGFGVTLLNVLTPLGHAEELIY